MILLLGKNGSGKSYISNNLQTMGIKKSVSYTTREKRPNEIDSIDYHFVTVEQFQEMIRKNLFIEYNYFNGNYYGTASSNIDENDIILSGGNIKKEILPYIDSIYYIDCNLNKRFERMLKRKDSLEQVFNRISGENKEYLFNYKVVFFDNNCNNPNIINEVYENIRNPYIEEINFKDSISTWVDNYKFSCEDGKILMFLNYEEYLLRRMYLEDNFNLEYYKENILKILCDNHYCYSYNADVINLDIDGKVLKTKMLVMK